MNTADQMEFVCSNIRGDERTSAIFKMPFHLLFSNVGLIYLACVAFLWYFEPKFVMDPVTGLKDNKKVFGFAFLLYVVIVWLYGMKLFSRCP